ncbi:methylenetetrahydrofolate reductase [Sphingomonas sp. 37zxx]|uniref:methylenetetrahydrofolate reductase n=1 Tax=Sphingomonas sp. 37zxx TaxID=1550073 RepID=UPI00053BDC6F|nr:methylenetetrahydrofolate reductase [Sphingomonas sp. 37zxx]
MSIPAIHPAWALPPTGITDGYSLEITAKDRPALIEAAAVIPAETPVAITFLPGESIDARIAAAVDVRRLGFEPMPHLSARRIGSQHELEQTVSRAVAEAGARRMFLVAGDPPIPAGPFADTMAMIETGIFEASGIQAIGIAGHPEGHPVMTVAQTWEALDRKRAAIGERGMATLIVTQFGFDADVSIDWLEQLRARGIDCPVRIGVPGPAGIKTLIRFAAHCGVGASATVLAKYGISLSRLLGTAGPDRLVDRFARRLSPDHGPVRLHFYPFGGLSRTVDWIDQYKAPHP